MGAHVIAIAWLLSLMLAPHSLTLVGNLTGMHQGMFFIWLIPALGLFWLTARSTAAVSTDAMGPVLVLLSLAGRWATTLMLAPLLLVSAGFAFNEIFVYWFPNFAFAFILLGVLLAVQLAGSKAIHAAQLFLLALVIGGLGSLIITGLWPDTEWPTVTVSESPSATSFSPYAVILLFVGFDLASNLVPYKHWPQLQKAINKGLLAAAMVISLWALASLLNVPTEKLSDSFIPHLLAARNIGGDAGRMIMGVVVIAGSCAAVNALFVSVSRSNAQLFEQWSFQRLNWLKFLNTPAFWLVFSALIVAALMAGGMAGTEEIDIYLRAGLILWLVYYGAIHLAVLSRRLRITKQMYGFSLEWMGSVVGATAMFIGVGILLATDPDRTQLLTFTWIVLAVVVLAVGSGYAMRNLVRESNGALRRPNK